MNITNETIRQGGATCFFRQEMSYIFATLSSKTGSMSLVWFLCFTEKMITSEALEGVPILVLANKQDVEVRLLQTYS